MGGIDLFVNLCHLLCGVPHGGWRGLGWRGNAFLSAGFAPWSPDRAPSPSPGGPVAGRAGNRVCAKIAPRVPGGWLLDASKSPPQVLAKFYTKSVAVFGRRNARATLRSCCNINKTYRPTAYPLIFMGGIPI